MSSPLSNDVEYTGVCVFKISLNQVKERASTATGLSKSMIERVMRRDKATELKQLLTRGQLFIASLV